MASQSNSMFDPRFTYSQEAIMRQTAPVGMVFGSLHYVHDLASFENCSPDEKLRQQFAARETEFPLSFHLPNYLNKSKSKAMVLVVERLSNYLMTQRFWVLFRLPLISFLRTCHLYFFDVSAFKRNPPLCCLAQFLA